MGKHNLKTLAIAALSAVFLLFFLSLAVPPSSSQTSFNWKWSPQVAFRLPAYNTVIAFSDWAYLDSFQWDNVNASSVKFVNFQIAGDESPLPSFGLSVQYANCTVNYVNRQGKAELVLSAASGTVSILTLYYPNNYPSTIVVNSEAVEDSKYFRSLTDWQQARCPAVYLDESNMKVQVKAQHSSPVTVTIYWHVTSQAPSIAPAPITPAPAPTPPAEIPTVVPTPPLQLPLATVGIVLIVAIVAGAFIYSQTGKAKTLDEAWRKRSKASAKTVSWKSSGKKSVSWKRKSRFRTLEE